MFNLILSTLIVTFLLCLPSHACQQQPDAPLIEVTDLTDSLLIRAEDRAKSNLRQLFWEEKVVRILPVYSKCYTESLAYLQSDEVEAASALLIDELFSSVLGHCLKHTLSVNYHCPTYPKIYSKLCLSALESEAPDASLILLALESKVPVTSSSPDLQDWQERLPVALSDAVASLFFFCGLFWMITQVQIPPYPSRVEKNAVAALAAAQKDGVNPESASCVVIQNNSKNTKWTPLTPEQRIAALASVKERVLQLRAARAKTEQPSTSTPIVASSEKGVMLTPEQRIAALVAVKERVSQLRASRARKPQPPPSAPIAQWGWYNDYVDKD